VAGARGTDPKAARCGTGLCRICCACPDWSEVGIFSNLPVPRTVRNIPQGKGQQSASDGGGNRCHQAGIRHDARGPIPLAALRGQPSANGPSTALSVLARVLLAVRRFVRLWGQQPSKDGKLGGIDRRTRPVSELSGLLPSRKTGGDIEAAMPTRSSAAGAHLVRRDAIRSSSSCRVRQQQRR